MRTLRTGESDDLNSIEEEIAAEGERLIKTGGGAGDAVFGGLEKGSIYMIAATTGGGKSTLLLGMAKFMARQNPDKKIMFITIEQNIKQVYKYLDARNISNMCIVEMENLKEGEEIAPYVGSYDYVFYDYLGALSEGTDNEGIALREDAKYLAMLAKEYDVPIITGAQAKNELLEDAADNKISYSSKYISNSKQMANLIAGGLYGVPVDKSDIGHFYNFKNRYQERWIGPVKVNVDYRQKELKDTLSMPKKF